MGIVTWNLYSIEIFRMDSTPSPVQTSYLNKDVCKFASSQKAESWARLADSSKVCSKCRAFECYIPFWKFLENPWDLSVGLCSLFAHRNVERFLIAGPTLFLNATASKHTRSRMSCPRSSRKIKKDMSLNEKPRICQHDYYSIIIYCLCNLLCCTSHFSRYGIDSLQFVWYTKLPQPEDNPLYLWRNKDSL